LHVLFIELPSRSGVTSKLSFTNDPSVVDMHFKEISSVSMIF